MNKGDQVKLARRANKLIDGFYVKAGNINLKCHRVRFKRGQLQCKPVSSELWWFVPEDFNFEDGNGNPV